MYKYLNSARYSLESSTLSLLERIDAFVYPLLSEKSFQYNGKELQSAAPQYVNLGQLHDTLEVELVDELPAKVQTYSVTIGYARREYEKMNALREQAYNTYTQARDQFGRDMKCYGEAEIEEKRKELNNLECILGDYAIPCWFWKKIADQHKNAPDSEVIEVESKIEVKGDYCRAAVGTTPRVRLVKQCHNYDIAMTYIHEMFHAYYDWNHEAGDATIEYVEEALVEYAMLRFVAAFVAANPQDHRLFDEARWRVRGKLTRLGTAHYGLGAVLYESYSNAAAWELLYRKGKFAIDPQSPTVAQYKGLFVAGSLQDTNVAVGLLLQILAEALNLPTMTAVPTQGMPVNGGTMIGGTASIPNTLQTTIVNQYDPQEAVHWLRKGFTKVQYHTILDGRYRETKQYMVFDMLVDDVNVPKKFIAMLPEYSRFYSRHRGPILMVNRGGVFDPATFSIVGGKWALTDGHCFLTDFIYDNTYYNQYCELVVCQGSQWGILGYDNQIHFCASEAVAQSICKIIDGKILIARTQGGNQMINASGTPLSKEYRNFGWTLENGVIEVEGTNGKCGLVAKDGTEVVAPICEKIFDNKILIACAENGNQQIVDTNGTPLSKEYDDFQNVGNGVLMVRGTNGKYGLVAEDGTELFAPIYKDIEFDRRSPKGTAKRDGKEFILCKNEDGQWGETQVEEDNEE